MKRSRESVTTNVYFLRSRNKNISELDELTSRGLRIIWKMILAGATRYWSWVGTSCNVSHRSSVPTAEQPKKSEMIKRHLSTSLWTNLKRIHTAGKVASRKVLIEFWGLLEIATTMLDATETEAA